MRQSNGQDRVIVECLSAIPPMPTVCPTQSLFLLNRFQIYAMVKKGVSNVTRQVSLIFDPEYIPFLT